MWLHSDILSTIPSQPVFDLTPKSCVLGIEEANTNCIVFLTGPEFELTI